MRDQNDPKDRIPDSVLAQYRLGELPPERTEALHERLEADPDLAARLEALDDREAALMRHTAPRVLEAAAEERARSNTGSNVRLRRILWVSAELAAVAFLLVLALPPFLGSDEPEPPPQPTVRDQSAEPYLRVFEQVEAGLEERHPGEEVEAGDQLLLHYAALGRQHGMVLSIGWDDAVPVHLPAQGAHSAPLEPEDSVALPYTYELDHAHGFERFFMVTSGEPFRIEPVVQAAHDLVTDAGAATTQPLALPGNYEQSDFLLVKPLER